MAYFYVDSTIGTRTTGGGTTKQTGSFDALGATSLYATRALAIADGAGAGDIIVPAVRHAESNNGITIDGPASGAYLQTIVAENANCDVSAIATAASETSTGSGDISVSGRQYWYGLWGSVGDDVLLSSPGAQLILEECTLQVLASADKCLNIIADGVTIKLINPTFKGVSGSVPMFLSSGVLVEIEGGVLESGPTYLTNLGFINGGAGLKAVGFDLSNITGTIFQGVGSNQTVDDRIDIVMTRCKTAASFSWFNETLQNLNHRLVATNCANTSAAAEYQFYTESWGGYVDDQDDAGIHREETTAFPSGTKTSLYIATDANASLAAPFWFKRPSIYAELSNASTDTLRFYFASTTALDNTDVWVEISYPDGTNNQVANLLSTRPANRLTDASAGTALTTDSGSTWLDGVSALVGYNEYYIDVDTSVDVGADCVPDIKIFVAIPSTVIYLDPVPDVVA